MRKTPCFSLYEGTRSPGRIAPLRFSTYFEVLLILRITAVFTNRAVDEVVFVPRITILKQHGMAFARTPYHTWLCTSPAHTHVLHADTHNPYTLQYLE